MAPRSMFAAGYHDAHLQVSVRALPVSAFPCVFCRDNYVAEV